MNWAARAVVGAFIGALAVLLIHPHSRPFLLSESFLPGVASAERNLRTLPENIAKISIPSNLDEAALWLQIASEQELASRRLTVDDAITCAEIADKAQATEPDNAFWAQMRSVFVREGLVEDEKRRQTTLESWYKASQATRWDDEQVQRLTRLVRDLDAIGGASLSWHAAVGYWSKSTAIARRLLLHSRTLAAENPSDLDLRVANIRNGALIRDGARSVQAAASGASMVDLAAGSAGLPVGPERAREETRGVLLKQLGESNPETMRQIRLILDANNAWNATVPVDQAADRAVAMTRAAVLTDLLPGCLMACSVLGLTIFLLGWALQKLPVWRQVLGSRAAVWIGMAFGLLVFMLSRLVFPAVWTMVAVSLFCISPDRLRSGEPTGLGVVYRGTLVFLALGVGTALGVHLVEHSVAVALVGSGAAIPGPANPVAEVPLQLCLLGLSMVLATAPAWGFFYRFPATDVLPKSLKLFGAYLAAGSVTVAVVAAPLCMALDLSLRKNLTEMLLNEPNHYFVASDRE